ncbi:Uncharacterised protein [uncultured archaeon]|nr:Uncharacterised protein [uncultured archaeon]
MENTNPSGIPKIIREYYVLVVFPGFFAPLKTPRRLGGTNGPAGPLFVEAKKPSESCAFDQALLLLRKRFGGWNF